MSADATERLKFQILTDHLRLEEVQLIVDSYSNSRYPYTLSLSSMDNHISCPCIAELTDGLEIRSGDVKAFCMLALKSVP